MDENKLIEMLIRLTDEVYALKAEKIPAEDRSFIRSPGLGLLKMQKEQLIREQHRLEFEAEAARKAG
jgi:hypothetical protein